MADGAGRWPSQSRALVARRSASSGSIRARRPRASASSTGSGGEARYVASGAIRTSGDDFPPRLRQIFEGVRRARARIRARPRSRSSACSCIAMPTARSSSARRAVRRLCAAFVDGPAVFEYAPREVKLAVVGQGRRAEGAGAADGADAAEARRRARSRTRPMRSALALCHAYSRAAAAARRRRPRHGARRVIGFLRGRLAAKHPPQLVVDVGGVGYEVEAPMSTFYGLPAVGAEVQLHTHLVVREDAHVLFGFGTERERAPVPRADQGLRRRSANRARRSCPASASTTSTAASRARTSRRWCAFRASAARRPSAS